MPKRYRYDKETKTVIPIDQWLAKYGEKVDKAHHVIPDLPPYMAVAGDMAGKMIKSRKEHREFLKRNNLIEVGNEKSYMMRNAGMSDDNPNLQSDRQREEQICRSLRKNLERLRSR